MTVRRVTISVAEAVAKRIKKAAGAAPVSTWVAELIEEHLDDAKLERLWAEFYESVRPSRDDVRAAEAMLGRLTKPSRRGRAA